MDGEKILLEVADPLLMDCLRQRVRILGFINDGTFSGSLAKLALAALATLIEDLLSADQQSMSKQLLLRKEFLEMIFALCLFLCFPITVTLSRGR